MSRMCRFPNIERWMKQHNVSRTEMTRLTGMQKDTIYRIQRGVNDPGFYTINAVLRVTGMTFEEAFREAEK